MAASHADIREELQKRTCDSLRELARSFEVRGYTGLTKEELEKELLSQVGEKRLSKALFPSWWARHNAGVSVALTLVLGVPGLILALVFDLPARFASTNASKGEVEKAVEDRNPPIAGVEQKDLGVSELNPPQFEFPSPKTAGVMPLTDEQRLSDYFVDAKVMIRNETNKSLKVEFAYEPYRKRNPQIGASPYVHRESPEVPAGATIERREDNFGGPVHVSIFADGKWTATNEWFDLRVVPRRTLIVTDKGGAFNCRVEFEDTP